jgi:hypothetical protein
MQDLDYPIFPVADTSVADPQPVRGTTGASILGPQNVPLGQQNPDLLAPPRTDEGTVCVFVCSGGATGLG